MNQTISFRPQDRVFKLEKTVGLILGGTSVAALLIGWTASVLWPAAEIVIAVARWL